MVESNYEESFDNDVVKPNHKALFDNETKPNYEGSLNHDMAKYTHDTIELSHSTIG